MTGETTVRVHAVVTVVSGSLSATAVLGHAAILGCALVGTRVRTPWTTLVQTRTVQVLKAALELPEPPDDERETSSNEDERKSP